MQTGTGTIETRAVFPNPKRVLLPGQFARLVLHGATRPHAILVPQAAVLSGQKGKFVFAAGQIGQEPNLPGQQLTYTVTTKGVAVWLRGLDNDVYFQIGLVTLIALAAKNAILIVEFAVLERDRGLSAVDAAVSAARPRFRPIVMTSLAFILGVVPLALSTGAGAASRHSIGTGVIGGMLAATFIAVLFIPLFYGMLTRRAAPESQEKEAAGAKRVVAEVDHGP